MAADRQERVRIGPAGQPPSRHGPPTFLFTPVRTRLLDALEAEYARGTKVLSFVAPTGSGKTVVMAELFRHLQHDEVSCFWVCLDERDASLEAVLQSIRAAIAAPSSAPHPTQAMLFGDEPLESCIDQLLDLLSRLEAPATIFIDNLNSCTDETLGTFLDALIFRTPPSLRLVWSSTVEPAIDTSRARLEGLIQRVPFAELNLNAEEIAALLGRELYLEIGASGVAAIQRRTEGWAAAVRMTQIILSDAEQPAAALDAFSGTDEDIAALLNRRVLHGFTPALRHFLLCLAQLRTFSVGLCRHVTGDAEADERLAFLLRRNVFVVPLDRNRKLYRFHSLFRDYLIGEAERLFSPEYKRQLFRRAAEWCEANEDWQDAIQYFLAADEPAKASRILDLTAPVFARDRGDILRYIQWVDLLLSTGVDIGWDTHLWYIWALVFHRRCATAAHQHERLADRVKREAGAGRRLPSDFAQRLDLLRLCIDILSDRLVEAHAGAQRWLASPKPKDAFDVGWVYCIESICLLTSFRFAEARQALRLAEPIMIEVGSPYAMGWLSLIQGTTALYEGDYAYARDHILATLARTEAALGEGAELCDTMAMIAAKCTVEMGLDEETRGLLRRGLRTAHSHGTVGSTALGFEAAINLWSGEADELVSISDLREVASSYPPRLSLMLSCYVARRYVALGRLEEALAEAGRIGLSLEDGDMCGRANEGSPVARYRDLLAATTIDLLIATRQFKRADALIELELGMARRDGRMARLVELGLSRMVVELHLGDRTAATRELTTAVRIASRRRVVRPFRNRAATIAALVDDAKPSTWFFSLSEERSFFAEICRGPLGDGVEACDQPPVRGHDPALIVVPTRRELELLTLIDGGLSNQQIADYTRTSIGTVKWHLKNLYRKFNVANRSAALARARTSGLLSR